MNPENLAKWLRDPQAAKPGSFMPNLNLSDAEVDELVAYLETLE
jgi:cytochrome c oxidase subunit 2